MQLTQISGTSMHALGDSLGFKVFERVCFIPWKFKTLYLKIGTNKLLNRWESLLRYEVIKHTQHMLAPKENCFEEIRHSIN